MPIRSMWMYLGRAEAHHRPARRSANFFCHWKLSTSQPSAPVWTKEIAKAEGELTGS
jgi:hypothetical protein